MKSFFSNNMSSSVLNIEATYDVVGDEEDAKHIVLLFIDELPGTKEAVKEACNTQNAGELRRLCHRLKGSTAYCVVPNIIEQVNTLHDRLREEPDNVLKWQPICQALLDAMDELLKAYHGGKTH